MDYGLRWLLIYQLLNEIKTIRKGVNTGSGNGMMQTNEECESLCRFFMLKMELGESVINYTQTCHFENMEPFMLVGAFEIIDCSTHGWKMSPYKTILFNGFNKVLWMPKKATKASLLLFYEFVSCLRCMVRIYLNTIKKEEILRWQELWMIKQQNWNCVNYALGGQADDTTS